MGTLAEGIKEIFATAKTTGSNVMLCGNDGTPDGHMTMDNLASVLGETIKLHNTDSLDDIVGNGIYDIELSQGNPFGKSSNAIMIVSKVKAPAYNGLIMQRAYRNNIYKMRWKWTSGWTSWHDIGIDIPSFYKNYNDLSSLASALGENTIRYYFCDRYNQGPITDVFCSYFDQELPSSEQPVIVKVRSNTIGMAVGIKIDRKSVV